MAVFTLTSLYLGLVSRRLPTPAPPSPSPGIAAAAFEPPAYTRKARTLNELLALSAEQLTEVDVEDKE